MRVAIPCFGRPHTLSLATGSALTLALACGGSSGAGLFTSDGGRASNSSGGVTGLGGALTTGGAGDAGISSGGRSAGGAGAIAGAASGGTASAGSNSATGASPGGGNEAGNAGSSFGGGVAGAGGVEVAAGGKVTGGAGAGGVSASGGVSVGGAGSGGVSVAGANIGGVPSGGSGGCSGNQIERCDGIDNDCNSKVDEAMACPAKCTGFALDGHGYMVCDVALNNDKASALCAEQGMRLAWIESAGEDAALFEFISGLATSGRGGGIAEVTIGASDAAKEGQWRWVEGGPAFWEGGAKGSTVSDAYVNWGSGRPNDTSREATGEDCAVLVIDQPDDGDPGEWNDVACGNSYGVLCETP